MDDTAAALPQQPMIAEAPPEPAGMSVSAAMDVLDEHHIRRSDYESVMQALEVVMGPGDEADMETPPEAAMAKEMFATGRNRKGPPDGP